MEKDNIEDSRIKQIVSKYEIDLESLKREQIKLAKGIEIKDSIDFKLADRFCGVENKFIDNKLLSCIIVINSSFEILDRAYSFEKVKFPYLPGYRNYRELDPMLKAYEKLSEKPDIVFIQGQGIIHPRLGLASNFSLSTGVPAIGIANTVIECEVEGVDVIKDGNVVGKSYVSKEGSNPMFISPGNLISIESALEITKKLIKHPHKKPEPLHLASKYAREVIKELGLKNKN